MDSKTEHKCVCVCEVKRERWIEIEEGWWNYLLIGWRLLRRESLFCELASPLLLLITTIVVCVCVLLCVKREKRTVEKEHLGDVMTPRVNKYDSDNLWDSRYLFSLFPFFFNIIIVNKYNTRFHFISRYLIFFSKCIAKNITHCIFYLCGLLTSHSFLLLLLSCIHAQNIVLF